MGVKTVHGHQVPTTVEELLSPDHTALVVIDMQNDFCSPGGHFDRAGKNLSDIQEMIPRLVDLVQGARSVGVPVIHVRQTTLPGGASDSTAWLYLKTRDGKDPDYTIEGSWGHGFVEGLEPKDGEAIIDKH